MSQKRTFVLPVPEVSFRDKLLRFTLADCYSTATSFVKLAHSGSRTLAFLVEKQMFDQVAVCPFFSARLTAPLSEPVAIAVMSVCARV